ncbi:MAG: hypothetical protein R3E96_07825 [Planctomycetota bacterium]
MQRPDARVLDPARADALVGSFGEQLEPRPQLGRRHDLVGVHLAGRLVRVHVAFDTRFGFRHARLDLGAFGRILHRDLEVVVEFGVEGRDGQGAPSITDWRVSGVESCTTGS